MKITTPFDPTKMPDKYGKYADEQDRYQGEPVVSFPFNISDVPAEAKSLAFTLIDHDAIPVAGFSWIHWVVANVPVTMTTIPADFSRQAVAPVVQGANSNMSKFVGGIDPALTIGYSGPVPPDQDHDYTLTVYALDAELDLPDGYYLNALYHAMAGKVLAETNIAITSRA
ncbi:YbhB/YbcL family Raf kinase inhibitor-like protein [Periweissella cryptocerci]|uniref:YbhB/YbcL family Raf kinase inhibitor-like protein n=1 Tax=Periweissella cryptocerci TaxID=2506420 RepID=A0A4P6YRF5_9LACO|nr:YbhB/YbcL family Raf kinase inhibitor-like protein [Periweissella cryptocerci]QBO35229.1 YbhB/YbcL family Raf kinase inhibitor-like protein [Periweissella cryptocerci]